MNSSGRVVRGHAPCDYAAIVFVFIEIVLVSGEWITSILASGSSDLARCSLDSVHVEVEKCHHILGVITYIVEIAKQDGHISLRQHSEHKGIQIRYARYERPSWPALR